MWRSLKNLFRGPKSTVATPHSTHAQGESWTIRQGRTVRIDSVFDAWTSGDLRRMLSALNTRTNLIDRHFLLMGIVKKAYRLRSDPEMAQICLQVSQTHLDEFPEIARALKKEFNGKLPRVSIFQQYATLLAERGDFNMAIRVCGIALEFGLQDGTKGGFQGRIERIRKKSTRSGA